MKTPRVSVVMPAYNSEKYIAEAIESILNQTYTDFEFIILNDGSTDSIAQIVKQYTKQDKRIKFVNHSKNKGIVAVLNEGLELCTGEYIARMDSDDISLSTRFEKQMDYMDKHPECGVLGTWFQFFGNTVDVVKHPEQIKLLNLLANEHVGHPTVMLRKSVIDKYGFRYNRDYRCAQDFELWSRIIFVTEIHNLAEVLLYYRWHDKNVSIEHSQKQYELTNKVKQKILNKLTDDTIKQQMLLGKTKQGILLPKWIGRICTVFVFNRDKRHLFRDKYVKD